MTNEQIKALSDEDFAKFVRFLPRGLAGRLETGAKLDTDIIVRSDVVDSVLAVVRRSETGRLYVTVYPPF